MTIDASAGSVSPARRAAFNTLTKRKNRPFQADDNVGVEPDEIHRLVPGQDRVQSHALVQGVLRHLSLIDYLIERGGYFKRKKTPVNHLWILRLAVFEKVFQSGTPDYALGEQAVELARDSGGERSAGFINAMIRKLFPELPGNVDTLEQDPDIQKLEPAVRWSIPEPLLELFRSAYRCEDFDALVRAFSTRQPRTWLRVNSLKTDIHDLKLAIESEGLEVEMNRFGLPALSWKGGLLKPWQTQAWQKGEMTIQDPGSMLAAILLNPQPGESVLDACSAPGGKTGHLWERMHGTGELVAVEIDAGRRDGPLRDNLNRLYGNEHSIQVPRIDSLEQLDPGLLFDRVLLDAPCLGLGLVSRHPEVRWDKRYRNIDSMRLQQCRILDLGSRHVKNLGTLLWVTCSPTLDENEKVIDSFLSRNTGWEIMQNVLIKEDMFHSACQFDDGFLRTRPDRFPGDGFAMVLLGRS